MKKIPKLRGRGKNSNLSIKDKPVVVNLKDIVSAFPKGGDITMKALLEKGVVSLKSKKNPKIKILGDGELDVKIQVSGLNVSGSAKEKIEKAGGSVSA
jgi:large subunit ribosomal protein L15